MSKDPINYSRNGEYQHGRTDGFKDAMEQLPNRNLDFHDESYLLGYFDGRKWAEDHVLGNCTGCSGVDDIDTEDIS